MKNSLALHRTFNLHFFLNLIHSIVYRQILLKERYGAVKRVEPVHLASPRRALVTIMEEAPHPHDAALLSEAALGEDWNRPEEDAAWAHLQPGKWS